MNTCPCGSGNSYAECCEPYVEGRRDAPTAEALLRSRYTAYAERAIDYLWDTIHPGRRSKFDKREMTQWARSSTWKQLTILGTVAGGENDTRGEVEFVARYVQDGEENTLREVSHFVREQGRWYFTTGHHPSARQVVRSEPRVGRNDPCTCGSGKKYKKCCGRKQAGAEAVPREA